MFLFPPRKSSSSLKVVSRLRFCQFVVGNIPPIFPTFGGVLLVSGEETKAKVGSLENETKWREYAWACVGKESVQLVFLWGDKEEVPS